MQEESCAGGRLCRGKHCRRNAPAALRPHASRFCPHSRHSLYQDGTRAALCPCDSQEGKAAAKGSGMCSFPPHWSRGCRTLWAPKQGSSGAAGDAFTSME